MRLSKVYLSLIGLMKMKGASDPINILMPIPHASIEIGHIVYRDEI